MGNYHKYLPVTPAEKRWGLYVVTAGHGTISKKSSYPSRNHPNEYLFNWNTGRVLTGYNIVYIARGQGRFETKATGLLSVTGGACFILLPNVWHRYEPDPEYGWEEYWVGLQGEMLDKWLENGCIPDDIFFETGYNATLAGLFMKMLEHIRNNTPGMQPIISGIAIELLGLLLSNRKAGNYGDTPYQKIERAKSLISEHAEQVIYYETIARELGMSYSLFRKSFRQFTGIPPGQYHLRLRIEKACRLIAETHLPIEDIALHTGFESVYYFSRTFKKQVGTTATDYRKKHLKTFG